MRTLSYIPCSTPAVCRSNPSCKGNLGSKDRLDPPRTHTTANHFLDSTSRSSRDTVVRRSTRIGRRVVERIAGHPQRFQSKNMPREEFRLTNRRPYCYPPEEPGDRCYTPTFCSAISTVSQTSTRQGFHRSASPHSYPADQMCRLPKAVRLRNTRQGFRQSAFSGTSSNQVSSRLIHLPGWFRAAGWLMIHLLVGSRAREWRHSLVPRVTPVDSLSALPLQNSRWQQ
jgi:hypothetical protein